MLACGGNAVTLWHASARADELSYDLPGDAFEEGFAVGRVIGEQHKIEGGVRIVLPDQATAVVTPKVIDAELTPPPLFEYTALDRPNVSNDSGGATNLSADGSVAVGYLDNGFFTPYHAFRWTAATGSVDLGTLDPANNANRSSYANDVTSDGSVVVGKAGTPGQWAHAFRWTQAGGMVDLGTGAGASFDFMSRAYGVSGDGSVIVGQSHFPPPNEFTPPPSEAFRWTEAGGFQSLAPYDGSVATDVSADGSVVVGLGYAFNRAFRWTETEGLQDLGSLPGRPFSAALAISDDGSIVVGASSSLPISFNGVGGSASYDVSSTRAFYWTAASGMQDLTQLLADGGVDVTGVAFVAAHGISGDGAWIGGALDIPGLAAC